MFALITPKAYIFIALVSAGMLYLVQFLDTSRGLASWLITQRSNAVAAGLADTLADLAMGPVIWAFSEPIGAIISGFLWPLALLWLLLFTLAMLFSFIKPAMDQAANPL